MTAPGLQHTAIHCNSAIRCNRLQRLATTPGPQHIAIHCDSLQLTALHTTTYGGTSTARDNAWTPQDLQYTATRCNSLQHPLQHTLQHREGRQRLVTTPGLPKTYLKVSLIPIFLYICASYILKMNLWFYRFISSYIYFHMLCRCMQICMCICVYI